MIDQNSMLYWWPKIKELDIRIPKTEMVKLKKTEKELMPICDGDFSPLEEQWENILVAARVVGFPLFLRTDHYSGKHNWKDTCYVAKEEDLKKHIATLIEESFMADILGIPINALVFREYIPMKTLFTAFYGDMPVNPEVRFFIKDRKVQCWHWYWIEEAIEQGTPKNKLPSDWRERICISKSNITSAVMDLEDEAVIVAKEFDGYFSVDFCLSANNEWVLIDMALAKDSWHPECDKK